MLQNNNAWISFLCHFRQYFIFATFLKCILVFSLDWISTGCPIAFLFRSQVPQKQFSDRKIPCLSHSSAICMMRNNRPRINSFLLLFIIWTSLLIPDLGTTSDQPVMIWWTFSLSTSLYQYIHSKTFPCGEMKPLIPNSVIHRSISDYFHKTNFPSYN